tara:strand:- start:64 stop:390 length:327 start_codon:yes stop_codon:yes gene_type:complete
MPIAYPYKFSDWYGYNKDCSSLLLTDVYFFPNPVAVTYYYSSSIGNAANLTIGDTIYTDAALTTTLPEEDYYQNNGSASTQYCSQSGYIMSMEINSSGVITAIGCYQP